MAASCATVSGQRFVKAALRFVEYLGRFGAATPQTVQSIAFPPAGGKANLDPRAAGPDLGQGRVRLGKRGLCGAIILPGQQVTPRAPSTPSVTKTSAITPSRWAAI